MLFTLIYQLCDLLVYSGKCQMWCLVRTDSSMEWLEYSSSLVLDATFGQLGPLSLLLCFTILCISSSSRDFGLSVFVSRTDSLSLCSWL